MPSLEFDEMEGFLPVSEAALPPLGNRVREHDGNYQRMNSDYHAKRSELRSFQERHNLGPLKTHTFFTVDCTLHSLWQANGLEHTWERVQQGGYISRVISGCEEGSEKADLWKRTVIAKQRAQRRFGAFFAPTFSHLPNGKYYAPYNRPNAIWFWLNHTDLTEQIFVLLDPDMLYLNKLHVASVQQGRPVAHFYGYMEGTRFDKYVCPLCPADINATYYSNDTVHVKHNYDVGPPWLLHISDFKTIMRTWIELVSMLQAIDDIWIIEMVAYAVACAFHGLPHNVIHYGMVDHLDQPNAWNDTSGTITGPHKGTDGQDVALLHYCFTWEAGEPNVPPDQESARKQRERYVAREKSDGTPVMDYYHFSKYRVPSDWPGGKGIYHHNVLECNTPLLQEIHTPGLFPLSTKDVKRNQVWLRTTVFLETALPTLNQMLTRWKLDVLNCTIPTPQEEDEFEQAFVDHVRKQGPDPQSVKAPVNLRKVVNLAQQLRTSHVDYWISDFVVTKVEENKRNFSFVSGSEARRAIWRELRKGRKN